MDISDAVGHFGRYQYKLLAIICWRAICGAFMSMVYQLTTFTVPHQCADEGWPTDAESQCTIQGYSNVTMSNITIHCQSWSYNSTFHESIVEEWDLVCDSAWLISLGYTLKALGNFILYIPSGQLADKFGRKPLALVGTAFGVILIATSVASNGPISFLTVRFLVGLVYAMAQTPLLCIYLESVGPRYRDSIVISFSGAWGLGVIILSIVTYFLPPWRTITLISAFLGLLPLFLLVWRCVDESTRWLLTVGKYEQAKKQIISHAKFNRKVLDNPDVVLELLKKKIEEDSSAHKPTFLDLWKISYLRKRSIILSIVFFLQVFIYHGFYITVGRLYGSLHINMALTGVVEIVVAPLYWVVIKFFDRRRGLLACFVMCGLSFLLTMAVPSHLGWLRTTLGLMGQLCTALGYILLYVYVAELFPTNLRTVAMSSVMSAGRVGGMLSPVSDIVGRLYGSSVLSTLYGVMALITSVVFFVLPETKHTRLPDTVAQSEKLAARNGNTIENHIDNNVIAEMQEQT